RLPKPSILTLLLPDMCHAYNPPLQSHIGNMSTMHTSQGLYKKTPIPKRKGDKPTVRYRLICHLILLKSYLLKHRRAFGRYHTGTQGLTERVLFVGTYPSEGSHLPKA
ncbi:disease resistance family protein / LRR family protein, partial [Prunus dulcis]